MSIPELTQYQKLGLQLFNSGQYYEFHEVLEDLWHVAPEEQRRFYQGLIQAAASLLHWENGNAHSAKNLVQRAKDNLQGYPENYLGIRLAEFQAEFLAFVNALEGGGIDLSVAKFPTIKVVDE